MQKTTIIDLLNTSVEKYSGNPFLWEKIGNDWKSTTYQQTKDKATELAAGLISLGVQFSDKIALLSEGRNAWIISELGILHTGAINIPLSIKLEESNDLIFRLTHSEAKFIFVSGGQLKKIRNIISQLPDIQKLIVFDNQENFEEKEIFIENVFELGKKLLAKEPTCVQKRVEQIKPESLANIAYTSGTTAMPKGVMLTHRNYTANIEQAFTLMTIPPTYRTLIILPLDHCFAHVAGFYGFMAFGASVGTVQTGKTPLETLKNIPLNIKELQPDLLLSVPALAKNFRKNIELNIRAKGKFVLTLFNFAMKTAYSYNKEGYNRGKNWHILQKPLLLLFDKILFAQIRQAFGGKLKFFIGGGALLDIELQRFFYAIGIPMFQGYGLSEATPIISANAQENHKLGSSGFLVKPMDLKICDLEGNELPNFQKGEIVIRGENVMSGYYKNEQNTAETIVDNWLHTGDMGYMDNSGFLYVVGRFKSLLIGSDGEKYSPEGIEEAMCDCSRYIEQIVLHNNQNPYTIALLVPNKEAMKRHVERNGLNWDSREGKICALNRLQRGIDAYRKGGAHAGEFPERWLPTAVAVLEEPFTEQNGLLNSTMKIVRGKVEKRYEKRIEKLYLPENKDIVNEENIKALV
ncbi:MAG: AMP-binding protein [Prevotellaceae bacterium]|jgi:long-chain acyl-CoA synthetase|nr:AMP-binding protein [Prevotellaceae bacterium]